MTRDFSRVADPYAGGLRKYLPPPPLYIPLGLEISPAAGEAAFAQRIAECDPGPISLAIDADQIGTSDGHFSGLA